MPTIIAVQNYNIMSTMPIPQLPHIMCMPQNPESSAVVAVACVQSLSTRPTRALTRQHQGFVYIAPPHRSYPLAHVIVQDYFHTVITQDEMCPGYNGFC
jgi:hypothetical protein